MYLLSVDTSFWCLCTITSKFLSAASFLAVSLFCRREVSFFCWIFFKFETPNSLAFELLFSAFQYCFAKKSRHDQEYRRAGAPTRRTWLAVSFCLHFRPNVNARYAATAPPAKETFVCVCKSSFGTAAVRTLLLERKQQGIDSAL